LYYEILDEGYAGVNSGVLKIKSYAYTALYIKFVNPVTVASDSNVILSIYQDHGETGGWSSARIRRYDDGANDKEYTHAGTDLSLSNGYWIKKKVLLTSLGYAEGDICEGIQIISQGVSTDDTCIYVDEIIVASTSLEEVKAPLAAQLKGDELATFDDENYRHLFTVSKDESFSVKDGILTVNHTGNYNFETLTLPKPITVKKGDYLVFTISSSDRVYTKVGGVQKELSITKDSTIQTAIMPLTTSSGYNLAEGTVISSIGISGWSGTAFIYQIHDISCVSIGENMLLDFSKKASEKFVAKESVLGSYSYPTAIEHVTADGCVKVTGGSDYNKFQVKLVQTVTITENTQISIRMRYVANGSTWSCRLVKLPTAVNNLANTSNNFYGYVAGEWCTVTFNAVDALGVEVGSELSWIEYAFGKGTVEIKDITYTELA